MVVFKLFQARLEYDVYLHEYNTIRLQPNAPSEAVAAAEENCNIRKQHYEQLKADVKVLSLGCFG